MVNYIDSALHATLKEKWRRWREGGRREIDGEKGEGRSSVKKRENNGRRKGERGRELRRGRRKEDKGVQRRKGRKERTTEEGRQKGRNED